MLCCGSLAQFGGREAGFLVDGFDSALIAAEEGFGADERRFEVDGCGKFVDCRIMLATDAPH